MNKSTKKGAAKQADTDKTAKGSETIHGLSGLGAIKGRLPEGEKPKNFYIPDSLTDVASGEGTTRRGVPESEWPSDEELEKCWGYQVGSIGNIVNVHLLCNVALPVEWSVVGMIETLQNFSINNGVILRHGYPYKTRSECRFPGFFRLSGYPEKGLVTVIPSITSELSNPWWVVKEYINTFRKEAGQKEITLQELRESVDACLRGKSKPAYPPSWEFQFDKTGVLRGKTKWFHQKRSGWRYVNVDTRNKRLEGIHKIFSAYNVILWEKF